MRAMHFFNVLAGAAVSIALFIVSQTYAQTSTAGTATTSNTPNANASSANRAVSGTSTATVGNREIIAMAAQTSVQSDGDSARVQLDDHVITVEPERLLVDGGERAKLPAAAKKIRLSLSAGRLTVDADDREVFSGTLSK